MGQASWIAVDWGTSSFRLWILDENDRIIDTVTSAKGMASLSQSQFEPTLSAHLQTLLGAAAFQYPVYIAGMAGARQGWQETPYRSVPCHPVGAFSRVLCENKALEVYIHGGLSQSEPADVMRGEEIQIAGLDKDNAAICLPGTHSKWVNVKEGIVRGFRTFMSGELFDVLRHHTVLRHAFEDACTGDEEAFLQGVAASLKSPAAFGNALFSLRAEGLLRELRPEEALGRLSGLVIGLELAEVTPYLGAQTVHLIGNEKLCRLYAQALDVCNLSSQWHNPTALTLAGLRKAKVKQES